MEPGFSPLRAGATAGRRAVRIVEPGASGEGPGGAPGAGAAPAPPPPRAVKFAEPPRRSTGDADVDAQVLSPPGAGSNSGAAAGGAASSSSPPPAKRVGFDLPAAEAAGSSGAAAAAGGAPAASSSTVAFSGVSRRKAEQLQREASETARQRSKYDEREVEGALEEIPDLEEEGREDMTRMIARAPRGHHPRVQPVAELQRDQAWVPEGAEEGGIDLSLLTACLCPSDLVEAEGDEVWEPDQLLAALKSELYASEDPAAGGSGDKDDLRQV